MGDRALLQVVSGTEFGPVVYCHWAGSRVPEIVRRLAKRMAERGDDLAYASARLVQECINGDDSALSFGIWNADKPLSEEDSHGDAGVVLIDCANGYKCQCFGGYLEAGDDGFPREAA